MRYLCFEPGLLSLIRPADYLDVGAAACRRRPLTVGSIVGRPCFLLRLAAGKPFEDWSDKEVADWAKAKKCHEVVNDPGEEEVQRRSTGRLERGRTSRSIWAAPMALRSTATY